MKIPEIERCRTWIKKNMWDSPRIGELNKKWAAYQPLQPDELIELRNDAENRQNLALVGTGLSLCILGIGFASAVHNNDMVSFIAYSPIGSVEVLEMSFAIGFNRQRYQLNELIRGTQEKPQTPLAK